MSHDFIDVETIPFDGQNIGMKVHIAATDFLFSDDAYRDLVVRLEFYDVLLGHLVEGSLYQTYYQFPSPT